MRNEKTGLPRTFPLPVLPQNNLSAKPYSFKTFKTLLKTHIFHEAFPDSHCLYSIILITLITLAKVIVGCIYVYETRLMPILCCKLPEDRRLISSFVNYIAHPIDIFDKPTLYLQVIYTYVDFIDFDSPLVPVSVIYVNIFVLAVIMCVTEEDVIL